MEWPVRHARSYAADHLTPGTSMKFREFALLRDVLLVEPEPIADERGFFSRTYCRDEFLAHGIRDPFVQCSISFSAHRGTLRGLHFQRPPSREAKLVRCTQGAAFDVVVDLRPGSATYRRWESVELTARNRLAVYVPPGFAHGLQSLSEETEILYQMTDMHAPSLADGVRWNDPAFGIAWPIAAPILSRQDASYPDLRHDPERAWPA
jgi:dTDP-4-dehydrorhamnose 3,5-epimerase